MSFFGDDFDPTAPDDNSPVTQGAAWIRDIKARLKDFLGVSFNLDDGTLLADAIPNGVTIPYGVSGTVYTSTGVSTPPTWQASTGIPSGAIVLWGSDTIPDGWLDCDGGMQLISDYPTLAAVVGTTFGGDGVNTFGVPDMRGRVAVGIGEGDADDASLWSLARKIGEETHQLTHEELPAVGVVTHFTPARAPGNTPDPSGGLASFGDSPTAPVLSDNLGSGTAHNTLQPSLGLYYIIKT